MLTQKFVGHLINDEKFCEACELMEENVKCDKCREHLRSHAESIYFYEDLSENLPDFIEEPLDYMPKNLPEVDFILVVGIHPDLLVGIPEYFKDKKVKAVIIPIENPKWVTPGLQKQVLEEFEKYGIQAAFPKPYCSLSKEENELNKSGFNVTTERSHIDEFIDYFKIGEPIVSFLLSKDGKTIEDVCVVQSAPCGSTFYILQKLKSQYIDDKELSLNERISKAHHAYPCNASMDQDVLLKDTILHVGGFLIRNAVRRALQLELDEGIKLSYVIV
jgi:hypothetical protein